jgi:hypothetical protein
LVKGGASAEEIFEVDRQILELLATIDEANREKIMEALERIWDAEEDYYETLEDIFDNLDSYEPYMGTVYTVLPPWKVFIKGWKPRLVIIREKLPPYPWRAKKVLVKPPKYRWLKPGAHPPKPGVKPKKPDKPPKPKVKPPKGKPGAKPGAKPKAVKPKKGKEAKKPPAAKPKAGKPKAAKPKPGAKKPSGAKPKPR